MEKKYWIKGGLIGAVMYPMLDLLTWFGTTFSYFCSKSICYAIAWIHYTLFPGEYIARIIVPIENFKLFLAVCIPVEMILGFLIGSIAARFLQLKRF